MALWQTIWLTKCCAYSNTASFISLAATMGKGCKKDGKDGKVQDGKEDGKVKDGKVKGGKEDGKDGKDQTESSCHGGLQAVGSCSAVEQWYFHLQRWAASLDGKGGKKGGKDGKKGDYFLASRTPPLARPQSRSPPPGTARQRTAKQAKKAEEEKARQEEKKAKKEQKKKTSQLRIRDAEAVKKQRELNETIQLCIRDAEEAKEKRNLQRSAANLSGPSKPSNL